VVATSAVVVTAAGVLPPITVPSMVPPLMSAVVAVRFATVTVGNCKSVNASTTAAPAPAPSR
jgi:hypothetical protein